VIFDFGKPDGSRLVFGEDFRSRQIIQSRGGVLVGCDVGRAIGGSISPTGVSSQVVFNGTQSTLINASQATFEIRFRVGAVVPTNKYLLCKGPITFNDNQWFMLFSVGQLNFYICSSAADTANLIATSAAVVANTDYFYHIVYNGGLAPASRAVMYEKGLPVGSAISGTLPTSMRAGGSPIVLFDAYGGISHAPDTDFVWKPTRILGTAFSAQECLDAYNQQTYSKAFGGGP